MQAGTIQRLFESARQALAAGRHDEACEILCGLELEGIAQAPVAHLRAVAEQRRGNEDAALAAYRRAIGLAPDDPRFAVGHASLLAQIGRYDEAIAEYRRAAALEPDRIEAHLYEGSVLRQIGRLVEAKAAYARAAKTVPGDARPWAALGGLAMEEDDLPAAADAFDRALDLDPKDRDAAFGRARIAAERGERRASILFQRAATLDPRNGEIVVGAAEVRFAAGEVGAMDGLEAAVAARPLWTRGQAALAHLRWKSGDEQGFLDPMRAALATHPRSEALWFAYIDILAGVGRHGEAADAAREARRSGLSNPRFILAEAARAGSMGDLARAESQFGAMPAQVPGRSIEEARHRLRTGEYEQAAILLEQIRREQPDGIHGWALTELLWRLTGDKRSLWLSGQPGLIGHASLGIGAEELDALAELLRQLHVSKNRPVGQSLRDGTQTTGRLLGREEAPLRRLKARLIAAIGDYVSGLPPAEAEHPLLRHRSAALAIVGSWSVRLTGQGRHVSHIHPRGLLSSAFYVALPADASAQREEGWLVLGSPPDDLGLELPPLHRIEPRTGDLILFPSYFYHGTKPFPSGERLTVAFDVGRIRPTAAHRP